MISLYIALVVFIPPAWSSPPSYGADNELIRNPRSLDEYLLPTNVVPLKYDVAITPYFLLSDIPSPEKRLNTFDGDVKIDIKVTSPTATIKLHINGLRINMNGLSFIESPPADPPVQVPISSWTVPSTDDDHHFLTLFFAAPLSERDYKLSITYTGDITQDSEGLQTSSFLDFEQNARHMVFTQFQPTGARRVFPCFDEPNLRSTFTFHISHHSRYTALSNAAVLNTVSHATFPDWVTTTFEEVINVPTYLTGFIVHRLVGPLTTGRYNFFGQPQLGNQLQVAQDITPRIMNYMGEITNQFEIDGLDKIDQVSIPDFVSGALESWGLIKYSDSLMTYSPGTSSSTSLQNTEKALTHQLVLNWFANLITAAWWNEIWLNEGFATYYEYHALASIQSSWQLQQQFILDHTHTVMGNKDCLSTTRSLVIPNVVTPSQAAAAHDSIAFSKGASIIRMLTSITGTANFQDGIRKYFTPIPTSSTTNQLWDAFSIPSSLLPPRRPLDEVMNTWATQPGYPVVTVIRNYTHSSAVLTQSRFLLDAQAAMQRWDIPITFTTENDPQFNTLTPSNWLTTIDPSSILNVISTNQQWVLVNLQQAGYYRVNYDEQNWANLISALKSTIRMRRIHVTNRAQLLDDAFALARARLLSYETAFELVEYLSQEFEYVPWSAGLSALGYLYDRLNGDVESKQLIEELMLELLVGIYENVNGFEVELEDSHIDKLKRNLILSWACKLGYEPCITDAVDLFKTWENSPPTAINQMHPDLRSVVYCEGIRQGGRTEYVFLFDKYLSSRLDASEQAIILSALGCTSDKLMLQMYLQESILAASRFKQQDAIAVITAVYNNPEGVDLALDFLLQNWDACITLYGGYRGLAKVLSGLGAKLNTVAQHTKLEEFMVINAGDLGEYLNLIEEALTTLQVTLTWNMEIKEEVVDILKNRPSVATTSNTMPESTSTTEEGTTDSATTTTEAAASAILVSPFIILLSICALLMQNKDS